VANVSEADIQVILHRLDEMGERLAQIHDEVRRTNGRVTELEIENAKWDGMIEGKRTQTMIATSVLSGGILAGIVWFVTQAI
jgi:UDP-N-acetylglucosamine enolpyruvyl transferase